MAKTFVMILGLVFVLLGVLGFIDAAVSNGKLLGVFHTDATHNVVHLVSGVVALVAASAGATYARLYAQVFGLVYGLVTVLGFLGGDGAEVLGLISVNGADNFLHLAIALSALYVGFAPEGKKAAQA